jgi:hypothetical protein
MKAHELARSLLKGRDYDVMIWDGDVPRELNLGPCLERIKPDHAEETDDCMGKIGKRVILIGYGDY